MAIEPIKFITMFYQFHLQSKLSRVVSFFWTGLRFIAFGLHMRTLSLPTVLLGSCSKTHKFCKVFLQTATSSIAQRPQSVCSGGDMLQMSTSYVWYTYYHIYVNFWSITRGCAACVSTWFANCCAKPTFVRKKTLLDTHEPCLIHNISSLSVCCVCTKEAAHLGHQKIKSSIKLKHEPVHVYNG